METLNHKAQKPKTVVAAAKAELVLVTYITSDGVEVTQTALVGKNNAILLNGQDFGLPGAPTPKGRAAQWIFKGIKEKLAEDAPKGTK